MRQPLATILALSAALALVSCGKVFEEEELPNVFELSEGVDIHVQPADSLNPTELEPGQAFAGVLAQPLYHTREILEPDGDTFEDKTLIAPEGAPVDGVVVEKTGGAESDQPRIGLRLTSITFHGGKTFPVETAPLYDFARPEQGAEPRWTFTLSEPADVALVIEFRAMQEEKGVS